MMIGIDVVPPLDTRTLFDCKRYNTAEWCVYYVQKPSRRCFLYFFTSQHVT
jgi:hypothetical protein